MGVLTRLRTAAVFVSFVMAVALLSPPALARPCANCEDPELPGDGGSCPTIAATTDPSITTSSPRVGASVSGSTGSWNAATQKVMYMWYAGSSPVTSAVTVNTRLPQTVTYIPKAEDRGKALRLHARGIGNNSNCVKGEYSDESAVVGWGAAPGLTSAPNITGAQQVGVTVSGYPGTWTGSIDGFDYVWRWSTGEHRGSGVSYTFTAADLGKRMRLDVTANRAGHNPGTASFTSASAVVAGAAPVVQTQPSVSGERVVGKTLTVANGTWSPAPTSYTYQWSRGSTIIPGATGSSYALVAADANTTVTVRVTAARTGHASGSAVASAGSISAAPDPEPQVVEAVSAPRVTGKAVYGGLLTAHDGVWSPMPSTVERQWLRNGEIIVGAVGTTYRPGIHDVGAVLSLRVTASLAGHESGVETVEIGRVAKAAAPKWTGKKPVLAGRDKVKKKVRVALKPGQLRARAGAAGAKITYQWLRNGKAIKKGASKRAYVLKKADRGKKLRVKITIALPGHKARVVKSKVLKVRNSGKKV